MKVFSTKFLVLAALFGALSYVSGLFRIPIGPVPVTLQTAVILIAAFLLPAKAAFLSQIIHFLLLFLLGGGTSLLISPSFGFILGFIIAAPIVSLLNNQQSHVGRLFLAGCVGELIFYLCGLPYMSYILLSLKGHSLDLIGILNAGLLPFIIPDLVKLTIAVIITNRLHKIIH